MLGAHDPFHGAVLVMDPIVAREFVELGFDRKERLESWIHEHVRIPAYRYWDYYAVHTFVRQDALNGIEPFASYLQAKPDDLLPHLEPDEIDIVVVGGSSNGQWSSFIGSSLDPRYRQRPEDVPIVSIDAWR